MEGSGNRNTGTDEPRSNSETGSASRSEAELSEVRHADSREGSDGNVRASVGETESPDHPAAEVVDDLLPDVGITCDMVVAVFLEAVEDAFPVSLIEERSALREVLDEKQCEAGDDDNDDS